MRLQGEVMTNSVISVSEYTDVDDVRHREKADADSPRHLHQAAITDQHRA